MELSEFDREFDIIYENINKGGAPGLTLYEKSVILTEAAEMLAKRLAGIDLSAVAELITVVDAVVSVTPIDKMDSRSVIFELPETFIKILNESANDTSTGEIYTVTPISPVEYSLVTSKPYKYPRRRTVWRLENSDTADGFVELIGRPGVVLDEYKARIVNLPNPIILEDLSAEGFTIRGQNGSPSGVNTNLNSDLHPDILNIAVGLAESYYLDKYGNDGSKNN